MNSCRPGKPNEKPKKSSFNHELFHDGLEMTVIHLDVCPDPDLVPFLGNGLSGEILQDQDAVEEERILSAAEVVDEAEPGDGVPAIEPDIGCDDTCNSEIVL